MAFPAYVHSIIPDDAPQCWPIQAQGINECGCTAPANALNLLLGQPRFDKDDFVRQAGIFFQRRLGGSPSPITGWLIKRHGYGTHFGNLSRTDVDVVLRDLLDRGAPVVVEIGTGFRLGPLSIYGQHSILLVGYSEPHPDRSGKLHEEYYFVDSQWPELGKFDIHSNDTDVDGVPLPFPGNRTMTKSEFHQLYEQKIYFPVFRTQPEHDAWYRANIRVDSGPSIIEWLKNRGFTGSYDLWVGPRKR